MIQSNGAALLNFLRSLLGLPARPTWLLRFFGLLGNNLWVLSVLFILCRSTQPTTSAPPLDTGSTNVGSSFPFSRFVAILALFGLAGEGRSTGACDCDAVSGGVISAVFLTDVLGALRCSEFRLPLNKREIPKTYLRYNGFCSFFELNYPGCWHNERRFGLKFGLGTKISHDPLRHLLTFCIV